MRENYRLLERIGRGGMGEIFTASDEMLGRIVVVKAIAPSLVGNDTARQRLLREARGSCTCPSLHLHCL